MKRFKNIRFTKRKQLQKNMRPKKLQGPHTPNSVLIVRNIHIISRICFTVKEKMTLFEWMKASVHPKHYQQQPQTKRLKQHQNYQNLDNFNLSTASYPSITTVKSMIFQPSLMYNPLWAINSKAIIFKKHSTAKMYVRISEIRFITQFLYVTESRFSQSYKAKHYEFPKIIDRNIYFPKISDAICTIQQKKRIFRINSGRFLYLDHYLDIY